MAADNNTTSSPRCSEALSHIANKKTKFMLIGKIPEEENQTQRQIHVEREMNKLTVLVHLYCSLANGQQQDCMHHVHDHSWLILCRTK